MKLRSILFLTLFIIALSLILNMCKHLGVDKVEKINIEGVYNMQAKSDSLIDELLISVDARDSILMRNVDSLQEVIDFRQPIIIKEVERSRDIQSPEYLSSPVYAENLFSVSEPIQIRITDTTIYNIIMVDSFVNKIIYKIDTIYYNSDEIKRLKLKKR